MATGASDRPFTDTRGFKVMRAIIGATNPLTKRVLDSRFAGPMAKAVMLLRFRGRTTGRWYTTPVGYVRDGDTVVVVTSPTYRWWKNLTEGAEVKVRLPDGWRGGPARIVRPDDPEFDETLALQVRLRGPGMLRGFGVAVDNEGHIAAEDRAQLDSKAHLVRIELAPLP